MTAGRGVLCGKVIAAERVLEEATRALARNADEQQRASDASGGQMGGGLLGAGPLAVAGLTGARGAVSRAFPSSPEDPNAPKTSSGYQIGPPRKPDITWDEDYVWGSEKPTMDDHLAYAQWWLKGQGAGLLWDDGAAMYRHYLGNSGKDVTYDLGEAYREDSGIAKSVKAEIAATAAGVDELVRSTGQTKFQVTGPATSNSDNPTTENWQKAIGGHQQWSSANVTGRERPGQDGGHRARGGLLQLQQGQADIGSGTADDVNGRFTTVGLAKPFASHGTLTTTITWPVGEPPQSGGISVKPGLRRAPAASPPP